MENQKKARAALRAAITKAITKLEEALAQDVKDLFQIRGRLDTIEKKQCELSEINTRIYDKLLDNENISQDDLEQEMELNDEYDFKCSVIKAKVAALEATERAEIASGSIVSQRSTPQQIRHAFKLPQIELKKFGGELKEWLPFWAQFKKIHESDSIDDADKFQYLLQATFVGSRARNLVESFPATGENYAKAVQCLKNRYGRDDLLVEVYIRELLGLVLKNTISSEKIVLSSLYDKLESQLRALETLQVTTEKCASMLLPLVESCLPEDILRTWQRSMTHDLQSAQSDDEEQGQSKHISTENPKYRLDQLMRFLSKELENEQKIKLALGGFGVESISAKQDEGRRKEKLQKHSPLNKSLPAAAGLLTTAKYIPCVFCGNSHSSVECSKAQKMSTEEKVTILRERRCCYNCLKIGHRVRDCRSKAKCLVCNRRHNVIICDSQGKLNCQPKTEDNKSTEEGPLVDKILCSLGSSREGMLQTFMVKLIKGNHVRKTRAIMDTGSQRSYLLTNVVDEMGYEPVRTERIQHIVFGGSSTNVVEHNVFNIQVSDVKDNFSCELEVLDQPEICGSIDPIIRGPWLQELEQLNIELTDSDEKVIEILIGADIAGSLLTGRLHNLSCGLVAVETKLGWTMMGCIRETTKSHSVAMTVTTLLLKEGDISNLWSLDIIGVSDPSETRRKEELQEEAKQHFQKTVTVDAEGRYLVHLPWLEDHPPLASNYNIALKRLEVTTRKLKTDNYYEDYDAVLRDWIQDGIIEEVPSDEIDMTAHYLPHRHVVKPNSTTKIRPVFDASANEKGFPSLNNCVEKGANLIEQIPSILIRFRLGRIGVIADIKKAFLQINLFQRDRNFLRFLWYDQQGQMKVHRHKRVVFGVSCGPFLLGAVIQHHLRRTLRECTEQRKNYDTKIVEKLMTCFYVDNCVTSVESEEELERFIQEATAVMDEAKFELRGWEYSRLKPIGLYESNKRTNLLGLLWNKDCDTLEINLENCNLSNDSQTTITKRRILSAAHRIFDPLGVICPVLLLPKLLLQQMWSQKLNWDEEKDNDVRKKFLKWENDLSFLKQIKLPRWLLGTTEAGKYSVHIFGDASQSAYSAVAFLRTETETMVNVQLIQARSRITPMGKQNKRITIPRLELLAANICARLYNSFISYINIPIEEVIFWSDSTTVLAWINREELWDVFVRNRVKEIRKLTHGKQWRYVSGVCNPADLPSRGCSARRLLESRWWEGPDWLRMPKNSWPTSDASYDEEEINKERKKGVTSAMMVCDNGDIDWYYKYFSKFKRIVRLIAWILRFKRNSLSLKDSRVNNGLTVEEIIEAEKRVLYLIQKDAFAGIEDNKLSSLHPFVGEDGLIRIKTKISYGDYTQDFCYPVVLPNYKHPVVRRLILEVHLNSSHAGIQTMMTIIRRRFWILGGRNSVRVVINSCVRCKRYKSKKVEVPSPPLPVDRIREAKVFEIVGIDFAGPLYLKRSRKDVEVKYWICLFTCAVYRAVHLELVSSLSTDRFIQCLRRFISRRGRPSVIYTDNGTNFVGTANALDRVDWDKINVYSSTMKIRWRFNPPTAAWWGGWWERLIGLMKQLLRRVLNNTSLDVEEMQTILVECESVINARTLTYVSEDPSDLTPITPNMFLKEIEQIGVADLDSIEAVDLSRRLKYRSQLRKVLRQRFQEEYLGQLRLYSKKISQRKIDVGELVLVGSDNTKRLGWPLARVEELIVGREGETRLVKLRTSTGVILRPVQRIFPLEVGFEQKTEEDRMRQILKAPKGDDTTNSAPKDDDTTNSAPKGDDTANSATELQEDLEDGESLDVKRDEYKTFSGRRVRPPPKFDLKLDIFCLYFTFVN